MNKHYPVISVIIPVYNVEKYIARCLDSVLNQNFFNIEIICINDGSTDRSLSILHEYAAKDSRICIIEQDNRGVSAARNAGLEAARGTWIAFVDSDDEVLPDIWTTILEEVDTEDAVCFSAEEIRIDNGRQIPVKSGYFDVAFQGVKFLQDEDLFKLSMTVWDKLFRRSKIEACTLRFPDGVHFEDNVFVLNFFILYRNVRFEPRKLYRYFRREGSIMDNAFHQKTGQAFDLIRILEPIYDFWMQHKFFPQKQPIFERICLQRLQFALQICLPWERAGLVYAMAKYFHDRQLKPENSSLLNIFDGKIELRVGSFPGRNISLLHLKPLQRILYIGNVHGRKVFCLLGFILFSWKKRQTH